MSGMDDFCSQCQERPEEGPCPLHDARPQPIVDGSGEAHVGQHRPTNIDGTWRSWCGYCARFDREMDAWSAGYKHACIVTTGKIRAAARAGGNDGEAQR